MSEEAKAASSLSPFEKLPPELNWKIFDYVPDGIFDLRLTSRLLRKRVDEYALNPVTTITLVEKVNIVQLNSEMHVFLSVHKPNAPLFELRLGLRNNFENTIVKRTAFPNSPAIPNDYRVQGAEHLELVRECMGKRVTGVNLSNTDDEQGEDFIAKLLDGIQFDNLDVHFYSLTEQVAEQIFAVIKAHGVERMILTVRNVIIASWVRIMLEFSNLVKSLLIRHPELPGNNNHYFFGAENVDWSPAIIEMLNRKLDHLIIETDYVGYLSKRNADHLRENLPLLDKAVWFETTCNAYQNCFDDTVREFWVSYDADDLVLKIRHTSNMIKPF